MASVKALLKQAREALVDAKDYALAKERATMVLEEDSNNYFGLVFLANAEQNLGNNIESQQAYLRAIDVNRTQTAAFQGYNQLLTLLEREEKWTDLVSTLEAIQNVYFKAEDAKNLNDITKKLVEINLKLNDRVKVTHLSVPMHILHFTLGNPWKAADVLQSFLPSHPYYSLLSTIDTNSRKPLATLLRIASLYETHETEAYTREVALRRKRLDAPALDVVQRAVEKEIAANSKLGEVYQHIVETARESGATEGLSDTEVKQLSSARSNFVEFLRRKLSLAASRDEKRSLYNSLVDLCRDLVGDLISSPAPYLLLLDGADAHVESYDIDIVGKAADVLPEEDPFGHVVRVYKRWADGGSSADAKGDLDVALAANAGDLRKSIFVNHFLLALLLDLRDWDRALAAAKSTGSLAQEFSLLTGQELQQVPLAVDIALGKCYNYLDANSRHEALSCFENALKRDSDNIEAIIGLGDLYLSRFANPSLASEFFSRALSLSPDNLAAKESNAWALYNLGELPKALSILNEVAEVVDSAQIQYRIGRVLWDMGGEHRVDKKTGSRSYFMRAIKLDDGFGPAYTWLGNYLLQIDGDRGRAHRFYAKAMSLDPLDEEAGRQVVEDLMQDGKVEDAVDACKIVVAADPRASWALKKMAFGEMMMKKSFTSAITSFQAAIRLNVRDSALWGGLGDTYLHEGKYTAAIKAFTRQAELQPENPYPRFKIALVKEKTRYYEDAVVELTEIVEELSGGIDDKSSSALWIAALQALAMSQTQFGEDLAAKGIYARSAETFADAIETALRGFEAAPELQCWWKAIGDSCMAFGRLSVYVDYVSRQSVESIGAFYESSRHATNARNAASNRFMDQLPHENVDTHANSFLDSEYLYTVCVKCLKTATNYHPSGVAIWNSLGVVTALKDPKLSQHAFIMAVELDSKSAPAWSNLGFLYLLHHDIELARKSFSQAQLADPEYAYGWLGQAFGNRLQGNTREEHELFAHSYELSEGTLPEANYHYSLNIMQEHLSKSKDRSSSDIAWAEATFALARLTELKNGDFAAYNLLGLCYERQKLYSEALRVFDRALEVVDSNVKDSVHIHSNMARVLCSVDEQRAAREFVKLEDSSAPTDYLVSGIASYFAGDLHKSLSSFQLVLENSKAEGQKDIKDFASLLVAKCYFGLGTPQHLELAQRQLLQSSTQATPYVPALLTLCSLGLVMGDGSIASAAGIELLKISSHALRDYDIEVDDMLSRLFRIQGDAKFALRFMARSVHRNPWETQRWARLAMAIARSAPEKSSAARICGQVGGDAISTSIAVLAAGELTGPSGGDLALNAAQRAIRAGPSSFGARCCLWIALRAKIAHIGRTLGKHAVARSLLDLLEQTAQYLKDNLHQLDTTDHTHSEYWVRLMLSESILTGFFHSPDPIAAVESNVERFQYSAGLCTTTEDFDVPDMMVPLFLTLSARHYVLAQDMGSAVTTLKSALARDPSQTPAARLLLIVYQHLELSVAGDAVASLLTATSNPPGVLSSVGWYLSRGQAGAASDANRVLIGAETASDVESASRLLQALALAQSGGGAQRAAKVVQRVREGNYGVTGQWEDLFLGWTSYRVEETPDAWEKWVEPLLAKSGDQRAALERVLAS
ncbi:Superkiller protein 3 [Gonapodya sp. JEL0774]|nr:Superkiller protein 3 [Gonapodya sp. JEL0774]